MGEQVRYGINPNPFMPGQLIDFYGNPLVGAGVGPSVVSVLEFGADPTGTFESTNAFNEALAALPTITTQNNGKTFTVPYGRITGGGIFLVNQNVQLLKFGPFVEFDGLGFTWLIDYNPVSGGQCIDLSNDHGFVGPPGSNSYTATAASDPILTLHAADAIALAATFSQVPPGQFIVVTGTGITAPVVVQSVNLVNNTVTLVAQSGGSISGLSASAYLFVFGSPNQFGPNNAGLLYWSGGIVNTRIDGTNALSGCTGIFGGSGEGVHIKNCVVANYIGGSGVEIAGGYWKESYKVELWSFNNGNAITMGGNPLGDTGSNSSSQGEIWCRAICQPGQNGFVVQNGAWFYNAHLTLTGACIEAGSIAGPTAINGRGWAVVAKDQNTFIQNCRLDVRMEMDGTAESGAVVPGTIFLDNANNCSLTGCDGALTFLDFADQWHPTHPTVSGGLNTSTPFSFSGWTEGDTTLSSSGHLTLLTGPATGS